MIDNPNILIADDDEGVRELLTAVVRRTLPGSTIVAVENGRQALDFYRQHGADLVISNFMMPEMNGPSLVRELRDSHDDVPIIMVSGSPKAEVAGMAAGVDCFIHKLDIMAELPGELKNLLARPCHESRA
ncbi:MAG TPA: response regulator [Chthoniobacteraceae bacterium]|nr:response regulator [Chthoniobacteraceae bacterium]